MLNKIKLLLELQELDIIVQEASIVHGKEQDSESIRARIQAIRTKLDPATLSRYDRLIKQGLTVVHEKNGMCMGCNLTIPVGDLNRIRSRKADSVCPHCGKFLAVTGTKP